MKNIETTLQSTVLENYIGGEFRASDSIKENINPSDTSDVVCKFYEASQNDVQDAIEKAYNAKEEWAKTSMNKKAAILKDIALKLLEEKELYGKIIAREAGKPLKEAIDEVVKSAEFFDYFAAEASRNRGTYMDSPRQEVDIEIIKEPIGVVGLITPWNYPLAIAAWKMAPALAFGNTVVLKVSSFSVAIAYILAKVVDKTDMPKGVFSMLMGRGSVVGNTLTSSDKIDGISFTGSVFTGQKIAKNAIDNMIRLQLEMGSKNSLIVLEDADLELAVQSAIKGSFFATGQKCTSSSRLIVSEKIHDKFVAKMKESMEKLTIGNALYKETQIGPAISQEQLEKNLSYVQLAKDEGAKLVCGGNALKRDTEGFFFEPTLFTDGKSSMKFNQEEIFGPIACVIKVKDYEEAIQALNDTKYGLSGGIITNNLHYAMRFKHDAKIGNVMINLPTAGMDNHVPFGGRKDSSYGTREKSYAASDFFTTTKTAYIKY